MDSGFDQQALDGEAREGLALGIFEGTEDEGNQVLDEFYVEDDQNELGQAKQTGGVIMSTLADKLSTKAARLGKELTLADAPRLVPA